MWQSLKLLQIEPTCKSIDYYHNCRGTLKQLQCNLENLQWNTVNNPNKKFYMTSKNARASFAQKYSYFSPETQNICGSLRAPWLIFGDECHRPPAGDQLKLGQVLPTAALKGLVPMPESFVFVILLPKPSFFIKPQLVPTSKSSLIGTRLRSTFDQKGVRYNKKRRIPVNWWREDWHLYLYLQRTTANFWCQ